MRARPRGSASGDASGRRIGLRLDGDGAKVLETSATALAGVTVRAVPDGDNVVEDNDPDDRNTVEVTAPSGAGRTLPSGTYVVRDWSTEWRGDDSYAVELELVEA